MGFLVLLFKYPGVTCKWKKHLSKLPLTLNNWFALKTYNENPWIRGIFTTQNEGAHRGTRPENSCFIQISPPMQGEAAERSEKLRGKENFAAWITCEKTSRGSREKSLGAQQICNHTEKTFSWLIQLFYICMYSCSLNKLLGNNNQQNYPSHTFYFSYTKQSPRPLVYSWPLKSNGVKIPAYNLAIPKASKICKYFGFGIVPSFTLF